MQEKYSEFLQNQIIFSLTELKATNITTIDVRQKTTVTDSMIICTGHSSRHVKSIAENVVKNLKKHKIQPIGIEGEKEGEWILMDYGNVIVHVMQASTRDFYSLETLWQKIH